MTAWVIGKGVVEITERIKLPILLLHSDEELFDALQCQLITLHQDANRIRHKLRRHLQHIIRERKR